MRRKHKILILGDKGKKIETEEKILEYYDWVHLSKIANIRDYDTIIINLLNIDLNKIDVDMLSKQLNIKSFLDIVRNGGRIIVLGDPRFSVSSKREKEKIKFLFWTGINFYWDDSSGDTVNFKDDYEHRQYKDYISNFKKWKYSLAKCAIDCNALMRMFDKKILEQKGWRLDIKHDNFCYNRYRYSLAFTIKIGIFSKYDEEEALLFGPIIFLPQINKAKDETLQIVLRDLCGFESELPAPEWLNVYNAPGQDKIDKKIDEITLKIKELFSDLEQTKAEKARIRTCLKLLYEREYALEPATRDILRELGAHVEDPSEPNKEDGWIVIQLSDAKYEGVIEIKSTKSDQFGEDGRKQLLDWIDRGRILRSKNYKGIFIGNSAVDKPLKERPYAFSDSWQKNAKLSKICAIKTEDLYLIYILKCQNKLDIDGFWKDLFETDGIFNVKPYITSIKKDKSE